MNTKTSNPMIGKIVTRQDKNGKHQRKILSEYYQYGMRLYVTEDIDTKELGTALADVYDEFFKTTPGRVLKRSKGTPIVGRQKRA
ncbi:hypothetical protein [Chitinophaga sp. LS1]|uniref:hypothetical protein n=1 Tax=Chitinophaga sp. LS1 TaxID=3051176 RepID=UPI002AABA638|nr:hypothetical protein [Chitinophaga sp. LS1]WPV66315.1 hypothetical protein QQL36_31445 [Chitinophaga sp. LS1]